MSAAPLRILVIDDEPPIRKLLRVGLSAHGYQIVEASNGKMALDRLSEQAPDLVILDLGLPDMEGHELLRTMRARNDSVPIVVLSSRDDETGKVQALDSGADDYVTKPFGMDELLARMRAALRHQLQIHGERPIFHVDDLSVDLVRRIVKVGDKEIKLSPKEYELLRVLVQHAGKVLTHRYLLSQLWNDLTDAQYLRVYVRQLRQKIESRSRAPAIHPHRNWRRLPAARPLLSGACSARRTIGPGHGKRMSGSPTRIVAPSRMCSHRAKPSGANTMIVEPCSNQPNSSPLRTGRSQSMTLCPR